MMIAAQPCSILTEHTSRVSPVIFGTIGVGSTIYAIGGTIGVGGTICAVAGVPTVSSHTFAGTQMFLQTAPAGQGSITLS